jgi:hypothetical protein
MSVCETTHWTLDCGEGHGCYLVEYSDTGELAGWGCQSEPVKGRPRLKGNQTRFIDGQRQVMFCCSDISRAALAQSLDDLFAGEFILPKATHSERVSFCATATMDEVIRHIGLSVRN